MFFPSFLTEFELTPGYGGYSANGGGSVNGTRYNQLNWQIVSNPAVKYFESSNVLEMIVAPRQGDGLSRELVLISAKCLLNVTRDFLECRPVTWNRLRLLQEDGSS